MLATKENAQEALDNLNALVVDDHCPRVSFIRDFLLVALDKLPQDGDLDVNPVSGVPY